jgi:arylsulfatase A-like enzyme
MRTSKLSKGLRVSAAALALVAAAAGGGCRKQQAQTRPDVILAAIDGLRADRVSAYGHFRQTTPFLDLLEAGGVSFRDAFAPSSWAGPSLASALTGLPPLRHGVRHGLLLEDGRVVGQETIAEGAQTLAAWFAAQGYRTVAVSASPYTASDKGYARGFQTFIHKPGQDAAEIARNAAAEAKKGGPPLFLLVQLSDLVGPRRKPAGKLDSYAASVPDAVWTQSWAGLDRQAAALRSDKAKAAELGRLAQAAAAAYDSVLAGADRALAGLARALDGREAVWTVFGTHGMEFLEHGRFGQGTDLYAESVRVPLIFSGGPVPEGRPRVAGPCSLIDVAATLQELLSGSVSQPGGVSLLASMRSGRAPDKRALFFETLQPRDSSARAVIAWPWKLMLKKDASGVSEALFHEGLDPAEQKNVIAAQPGVAEELRGAARQWWGM